MKTVKTITVEQIKTAKSLLHKLKTDKQAILSVKEQNILKRLNYRIIKKYAAAYKGIYPKVLGRKLHLENEATLDRCLKSIENFITQNENTAKRKPVSHPKTDDEKKSAWIKRLIKLTNISLEQASYIADAKLEYKTVQLIEMESRQEENYSRQREKLINKLERSNPLRPIKNKEHAESILAAHKRHTETDYDMRLEEARELAQIDVIPYDEIKSYARKNMRTN